jgi:deoxyribodipyrimidine photo-lyase
MPSVPALRITKLNSVQPRADGDFVVYWMTAYRRTRFNFAIQRAVEWSNKLKRPLVILEAIRSHYRWNSDRFHRFILDGMVDNAVATKNSKAFYYPYVELKNRDGQGLLEKLAKQACIIVADDFPCFFHPSLYHRIAKGWSCAVELVDSNGILPMRATDRTFTVAHSYRRYMQKEIVNHLDDWPEMEPLTTLKTEKLKSLPTSIIEHWPKSTVEELAQFSLEKLDINHSVLPTALVGGTRAAEVHLATFIDRKLDCYSEDRNEPSKSGSSGLSPYLHFGHVSSHEIFERIATANRWSPTMLSKPNGKMNGFWNMSEHSEAFVDQLLTWREIGFNLCWREPNYDRYSSLPTWAATTLGEHEADPRPFVYSLEQFESATTHDELWNSAQRQLVREGLIHNYLRMLWGKKILHWTSCPQDALKIMLHLNNKYALDGRDPNSYSGIFWILGRYDRAWGPERPIFGKVRYMTSESTRNKFSVDAYLKRFSARI